MINKLNSVSYEREKSQSGQYPDFNSFMEYLYIKNVIGDSIKGPNEFISIKSFYEEMKQYKDKNGDISLDKNFEKNLHISMAESGCQNNQKSCGFNIMEYDFTNRKLGYSRVIVDEKVYEIGKKYTTDF